MAFVRSSKYRHVFGVAHNKEGNYTGIKVTRNSGDSTFCAVNPKFVAIVVQGAGGGPFLVLPLDKVGRLHTDQPMVNGHKQPVFELAWSPFNDNLIASASEDCTIKLWEIPDEGIKTTMEDPWQTLQGHEKRVSLIEWHPTADNILASGSYDNTVIVWNVLTGESICKIEHPDAPTCISWNYDGSKMATTCKDKMLRVMDPRKEHCVSVTEKSIFGGSKPSKCVFLKNNKIFCVGFSRMSIRLYAVIDSKDLNTVLVTEEIDNANGTIYLHYDPDNNIVFTYGKGDAQIKYYEMTDAEPYVHFLSVYQSTSSHRGGAWMPKRGLDFTTCEIAKCYKLIENACEPVSLIVPRKSDLFQDDIYPDCSSYEPSLTAEEYKAGKNAPPKTMDIRPYFDELKASKGGKGTAATKSNKPVRSLSQRPAKTLSVVSPAQNGASNTPNVDLDELVEEVKKLKATVRKVCRRLTVLEKQVGEVVADDDHEEE